jgi:hypothetical protein
VRGRRQGARGRQHLRASGEGPASTRGHRPGPLPPALLLPGTPLRLLTARPRGGCAPRLPGADGAEAQGPKPGRAQDPCGAPSAHRRLPDARRGARRARPAALRLAAGAAGRGDPLPRRPGVVAAHRRGQLRGGAGDRPAGPPSRARH